jgi:hypothetical protein
MPELTFADIDRANAARIAKQAECIERLERILLGEFDAAELGFIWTFNGPALSMVKQAIQNARAKAR